jgi:hypothetical protein
MLASSLTVIVDFIVLLIPIQLTQHVAVLQLMEAPRDKVEKKEEEEEMLSDDSIA